MNRGALSRLPSFADENMDPAMNVAVWLGDKAGRDAFRAANLSVRGADLIPRQLTLCSVQPCVRATSGLQALRQLCYLAMPFRDLKRQYGSPVSAPQITWRASLLESLMVYAAMTHLLAPMVGGKAICEVQ